MRAPVESCQVKRSVFESTPNSTIVKKYPEGLFQLHPTNRGVALYRDRVYMATTDRQLVALDTATGAEIWAVPIDDYKSGCYSTLAPLAARQDPGGLLRWRIWRPRLGERLRPGF